MLFLVRQQLFQASPIIFKSLAIVLLLYKLKNILKHCCPFQRYVCNFFQYRLKTRNRARSVAFLDLKMMSFFVILIILFLLFFELLVGLPPFYQNCYIIFHTKIDHCVGCIIISILRNFYPKKVDYFILENV